MPSALSARCFNTKQLQGQTTQGWQLSEAVALQVKEPLKLFKLSECSQWLEMLQLADVRQRLQLVALQLQGPRSAAWTPSFLAPQSW